MAQKRSIDLTLIAIVVMLLGIFYLIEFTFSIGNYGSIRCLSLRNLLRLVSVHVLTLFTVTGIGIFFQREWARLVTVIVAAYFIMFSFYEYVIRFSRWLPWELSQPDFWLAVVVPFCACIFLLTYLIRPKVREQFT